MGMHTLVRVALGALALTGCAAAVGPGDGGSSGDAAITPTDAATPPDAVSPVRCAGGYLPGQSFPAPDGCNTCTCNAGGVIACTEIACIDAGPAPIPCNRSDECPNGAMCRGPAGCGVAWTCQPIVTCTDDAVPYCTCDGRTVFGSSACPPEPFRTRGSCETTSLVECNPNRVACDLVEPRCPEGQTASVNGACWGPCVPACQCAAIACMTVTQCPSTFSCIAGSCRPRGLMCP